MIEFIRAFYIQRCAAPPAPRAASSSAAFGWTCSSSAPPSLGAAFESCTGEAGFGSRIGIGLAEAAAPPAEAAEEPRPSYRRCSDPQTAFPFNKWQGAALLKLPIGSVFVKHL